MNFNPYSAPTASSSNKVSSGDTCPQCRGTNVRAPKFTWWGGFLGPKIFHHRVCESCRFAFNAKTGRSNKRAVLAYAGVATAIGIGLGVLFVVNFGASSRSVDLTAVKRGCMKTCQASSPAAECDSGCTCIVHELEQMEPKKVAALLSSAASAHSLPPELDAATKRCMSTKRR